MGGYGSGRRSNRQTAEDYPFVDVNYLHRKGHLRAGWIGSLSWSRGDADAGRVDCRAEQGRFVLSYRVRQYGGAWEPVTQPLHLTYANCHYGGQRPYFLCSGVVNGQDCGRRVGKLFCAGTYFLCRHCYRLNYHSQSLDQKDRLLRRANKTRKALGGQSGTASWIPFKPKGMHQRTYDAKRAQIERDERQANHLFLKQYAHVLSREEREMYFAH